MFAARLQQQIAGFELGDGKSQKRLPSRITLISAAFFGTQSQTEPRSVRLVCQPTSQQYYSLVLNQHQASATSQSAVLFSYNKSTPATSHSQANIAFHQLLKRANSSFTIMDERCFGRGSPLTSVNLSLIHPVFIQPNQSTTR